MNNTVYDNVNAYGYYPGFNYYGFGISLSSSSHNIVSGNTAYGNTGGICLYSTGSGTNNTVSYNTILDSASSLSSSSYGIEIYMTSGNQVYGNYISNTYEGIYVYDADNNFITNNVLESNTHGINLINSDSNVVSGNSLHLCTTPIQETSCNGNTIVNNNITYGVPNYSLFIIEMVLILTLCLGLPIVIIFKLSQRDKLRGDKDLKVRKSNKWEKYYER